MIAAAVFLMSPFFLLLLLKDNPSFNEIGVGALVAETYPWADRTASPYKMVLTKNGFNKTCSYSPQTAG